MVNRDLVRCAERLFIIGGGNVGLIAGYHALQARIEVVGLIEALPECGGYKVHKDKLVRFGVPIYTSHTILSARMSKATDRTVVLKVRAPGEYAKKIAGILVQNPEVSASLDQYVECLTDDMIVCRCERVTMKEIKDIILSGSRDVNEIKSITRAGMGACGGKTCEAIIMRAFKELGIPEGEVTPHAHRPLFVEVPFGVLAGAEDWHNT